MDFKLFYEKNCESKFIMKKTIPKVSDENNKKSIDLYEEMI